jgi:hypothetical protein
MGHNRPGDRALPDYTAKPLPTAPQSASATAPQKPWKLGDPIVEPQGFYKLADGRWVMSRECEASSPLAEMR